MAITSPALGSLLTTQASYNDAILKQMFWSNKYDANAAKLQTQVKYETQWEKAMDSAMDTTRSRELTAGNVTVGASDFSEASARRYAEAKVSQYDEELSLELADLDIEYDSMKTMYETLAQKLQTDKDSYKQLVGTCVQDTGLLNT